MFEISLLLRTDTELNTLSVYLFFDVFYSIARVHKTKRHERRSEAKFRMTRRS